jgi:hypothetical protein
MASRKEFFAATAASVGALMTPSPQASPSPTPAPSAAAREFALRMRAFDPTLSDAQIEAIASGIEATWKLGDSINHKGAALKNSDEPVPSFSV